MADKNDITFEIMEHIGTIDVIDGTEQELLRNTRLP